MALLQAPVSSGNTEWNGIAGGGIVVHVEALIPVGVERLLDDACRLCLLAIDGGYGEGIGKSCRAASVHVGGTSGRGGGALTEDISLVKAVGGDDWILSVRKSALYRSDSRYSLVTRRLGWAGRSAMMFRALVWRQVQVVGIQVEQDLANRAPTGLDASLLKTVCLYVCLCTCLEEGPCYEGETAMMMRMRLRVAVLHLEDQH